MHQNCGPENCNCLGLWTKVLWGDLKLCWPRWDSSANPTLVYLRAQWEQRTYCSSRRQWGALKQQQQNTWYLDSSKRNQEALLPPLGKIILNEVNSWCIRKKPSACETGARGRWLENFSYPCARNSKTRFTNTTPGDPSLSSPTPSTSIFFPSPSLSPDTQQPSDAQASPLGPFFSLTPGKSVPFKALRGHSLFFWVQNFSFEFYIVVLSVCLCVSMYACYR